MASLEYIVRPWQTPNSHGAIVIPSTPQNTREKATLTWGAKATMPAQNTSGINVVCCSEESTEFKREGETVRIQGNGEDNWIDVFRSNKLHLKKKEKNTCASDWDQFSGVGLEITDALAEFEDALNSGTTAGNNEPKTCGQVWSLNNNTTGA